MSIPTSKSTESVSLNGPNDWRRWNHQFLLVAEAHDVLPFVNGETEPLRRPDRPDRPTARPSRGNRENDPTVYETQLRIYDLEMKQYEIERRKILEAKKWILSTVAGQYQESACSQGEDLASWYTKLQQEASGGAVLEKKLVRDKYREAITPLNKPPKDWNKWITNWEDAMTQGANIRLPDCLDPTSWFSDLTDALAGALPM